MNFFFGSLPLQNTCILQFGSFGSLIENLLENMLQKELTQKTLKINFFVVAHIDNKTKSFIISKP